MKFIVICLCYLVPISFARNLPSFIHLCRPKHEDVSECIKKNIETLKPKLRNGIPELLIPSFNPFEVPSAEFKLGSNFKASIKNLQIVVPKSFTIEDLKIKLSDNSSLELKVRFPEVRAQGQYEVKGQLLVLQLDGSGLAQFNFTNLAATIVSSSEKVKKNGKEYLVPTYIDIKPELESINVHLDNLFPNNQEMTDQANKLFNDNQKVLFEDISPLVLNLIKKMLSNYITNFFSKYSYYELFPDD